MAILKLRNGERFYADYYANSKKLRIKYLSTATRDFYNISEDIFHKLCISEDAEGFVEKLKAKRN
jgi:hypothetical protein